MVAVTLPRVAAIAFLVTLGAACGSPRDPRPEPPNPARTGAFEGVVDASCAGCRLGLATGGCDLAVRIDGRVLLVEGTGIDEHGDAHAADGFCNAIRRARVRGRIEGDRFVADSFELLPAGAHGSGGA